MSWRAALAPYLARVSWTCRKIRSACMEPPNTITTESARLFPRSGELRHDVAGEELERPEALAVADPSEVDLHRRLQLAECYDMVLALLDHLIGRSVPVR